MRQMAAIDIGSNALRLVIGNVDSHNEIHISKKFREPVRLGHDVFLQGFIGKKTTALAIESFDRFRRIIDQNAVTHTKAIATSALREAKNRLEFIEEVQKKTGILIQCIDGAEEARLIFRAIDQKLKIQNKNSIIIDIGGGSVEVIISIEGRVRGMQSFAGMHLRSRVRHGDLAPDNILVSGSVQGVCFAKVADFGEAHCANEQVRSGKGVFIDPREVNQRHRFCRHAERLQGFLVVVAHQNQI